MFFPANHPTSLADVARIVEHAALPATRRRDLLSAVNRICAMAGHHPGSLQAEALALRQVISAIRPAAHGIGKQTFANIRCNFTAALHLAGVIDPMPRGLAQRDPAWAPLVAGLPDRRTRNGLAAFLNRCARQGVPPDAVDDETVQAFLVWLNTRTIYPKPRDLVRRTPILWNEARGRVQGWPNSKLQRISFTPPQRHLAWDQLCESFRRDADAYLAMRENPDLFDDRPDAPTRPLAVATLRQQREHLRLAASVLVAQGHSIDTITSLTDLVDIAAFKTILRHYHDQAGGKANAFATGLATTLKQVARYFARVSPDHLAELKRLAGKLPSVPFDLTDKNKALLRRLEADDVRARLYYLPEHLFGEVTRDLDDRPLRFVDAQVALAVDIVLVAPLRPQNLTTLNWRRHFSEPDGARGRLVLHIPAEETKTRKRELVFEIPSDVARRIRWYRQQILPRLGADPNGALFVVHGGKPKNQSTLSQQITKVIEAQVGIFMSVHQFRHVAAVFYLEDHPEDFETVRALLGHGWSKTTLVYAGQSSRRASRAFGSFVVQQREALKLKRRRSRRRKRT